MVQQEDKSANLKGQARTIGGIISLGLGIAISAIPAITSSI
jgi:hypothetical protein